MKRILTPVIVLLAVLLSVPQTSSYAGLPDVAASSCDLAACDGGTAVAETVDAERRCDIILCICIILIIMFPPDGDVDGVWDCPPYDWRAVSFAG